MTKKKKKNYRLRKSVRRTLGALFMISAIIIAAIPFPDAAATDGTQIQSDGSNDVTIEYGVTESDLTAITQSVTLKPSSDNDTDTAYVLIKEGSDYKYKWQFKYFVNDNDEAIITEYNSGYTVQDVTLDKVNTNTYVEVIEEGTGGFKEFFTNSTTSYTYTYDDWANSAMADKLKTFSYYFPVLYENFVDACEEYKSAIAADPSTTIQAPSTTGYVKDITDSTLRKAYYLENGFLNNSNVGVSFDREKFELLDILKPIDKTANPGSTAISEVYYIVKLKNPNEDDGIAKFNKDTNGFLYSATQSYDIVGIGQNADGKGAFQGVNTYLSLTLPQNIKYIADKAFMGSAVTEITINNVEVIGNQAFKGSKLEKVNWGIATTKIIGAEAFSGTQLTSISIPSTVEQIAAGAFYDNDHLTSIDIDDRSNGVRIEKYAFYECESLNSLDFTNEEITYIGEGAFAMQGSPKGNFTSFKFPSDISTVANLETKILAGRTNLQTVVMPAELGRSKEETLPEHIFLNCSQLSCVEFPDNQNDYSGLIEFKPNTFSSVTNPEFYVKGPKLAGDRVTIAGPRKSTWACTMLDGSPVPYMYEENGKSYYEVCQDDYLLSIDNQGILQKCNFVERDSSGDLTITDTPSGTVNRLIVPGTVGKLPIKAIAQGCFTKTFLQNIEGPLVIKDGGELKEIADNVFAEASFTHVYLGDSVEKIGANSFANCKALTQVTIGKNIKQIGDSAFKGCSKLEQVQFVEPDNLSTLQSIGSSAFATGASDGIGKLVFIGAISPEYVPFAWAMDTGNYVDELEGVRVCYKTPAPTANTVLNNNYSKFTGETYTTGTIENIPTNLTVILDNSNNLPTLVDYQHYSDIDENIRQAYEEKNADGFNMFDEQQIQTAFNIVVPEGVKSIDAKRYFNEDKNLENWAVYFVADGTKDLYKDYGLFAGNFDEYPEGSTEEKEEKGNDRIQSVILNSVEYLPDEVFDNCENLETVQIGDDLTEIGSIPFSDCTSLSSVTFGNDKFTCNNGIIYENQEDNTKEIIECLAGRGQIVGTSNINLNNDPDLATTTKIREAAFSECPYLTAFDLTGVSTIDTIPESCFEDCTSLTKVDLSPEVKVIEDRAFATDSTYLEIIVRGREVGFGKEVCGNSQELAPAEGGTLAYLNSYEGTAVRAAAKNQGIKLIEPALGESYTFKFYDETGLELIKIDYVEHGGNAEEPEESEIPVIAGKKFVGWNKSLKNITADDFALAVYESDGTGSGDGTGGNGNGSGSGTGSGSGNGSGTTGDNVNGGIDTDGDGKPDVDANGNKLYKLTVTNGEGSGYYPAGKTVTIKSDTAPKGTTFANWSCSNEKLIFDDSTDWITNLTMIASDVTVIANYTGQYTLEVEYGSGSGSYPAGAKVAISAVEAPQGRKFASWVTKTNGLNIESSTKESTVITMPASNAKVTATYMDTGSISGNSTSSKNNTSVVITKPGISDKDKASAYVTGSSDNFIVKISESLEAADEVQQALQKKYPDMSRIKYFAMDISLYDAKGVNKITDTEGLKVNITIPIPDALREYAGNNRVGAVVNGELETLNPKFTTINGVPSVTFTATHFSPYTIYVDTGNMTVTSTLDSTPKTGDGIHPKWFLSIGLACISIILFTKKDRRYTVKAYH